MVFHIKKSVVFVVALFAVFFALLDYAAASSVGDRPIAVIRFNQQHVYFQDALRKVVSEVREVRGDADYTVLSVVPAASKEDEESKEQKKSESRLNSVVYELRKLGVEPSHLSYKTSYSDDVQFQEVRIFVK